MGRKRVYSSCSGDSSSGTFSSSGNSFASSKECSDGSNNSQLSDVCAKFAGKRLRISTESQNSTSNNKTFSDDSVYRSYTIREVNSSWENQSDESAENCNHLIKNDEKNLREYFSKFKNQDCNMQKIQQEDDDSPEENMDFGTGLLPLKNVQTQMDMYFNSCKPRAQNSNNINNRNYNSHEGNSYPAAVEIMDFDIDTNPLPLKSSETQLVHCSNSTTTLRKYEGSDNKNIKKPINTVQSNYEKMQSNKNRESSKFDLQPFYRRFGSNNTNIFNKSMNTTDSKVEIEICSRPLTLDNILRSTTNNQSNISNNSSHLDRVKSSNILGKGLPNVTDRLTTAKGSHLKKDSRGKSKNLFKPFVSSPTTKSYKPLNKSTKSGVNRKKIALNRQVDDFATSKASSIFTCQRSSTNSDSHAGQYCKLNTATTICTLQHSKNRYLCSYNTQANINASKPEDFAILPIRTSTPKPTEDLNSSVENNDDEIFDTSDVSTIFAVDSTSNLGQGLNLSLKKIDQDVSDGSCITSEMSFVLEDVTNFLAKLPLTRDCTEVFNKNEDDMSKNNQLSKFSPKNNDNSAKETNWPLKINSQLNVSGKLDITMDSSNKENNSEVSFVFNNVLSINPTGELNVPLRNVTEQFNKKNNESNANGLFTLLLPKKSFERLRTAQVVNDEGNELPYAIKDLSFRELFSEEFNEKVNKFDFCNATSNRNHRSVNSANQLSCTSQISFSLEGASSLIPTEGFNLPIEFNSDQDPNNQEILWSSVEDSSTAGFVQLSNNPDFRTLDKSTVSDALSTGSKENFGEADKRLREGMNRITRDKSFIYSGPRVNYGVEDVNKKAAIKSKVLLTLHQVTRQVIESGDATFITKNQISWGNCVFENGILKIKPEGQSKNTVINYARLTSRKKFSLIIFLLGKIFSLLTHNSICTQREIYYQLINYLDSSEQIGRAMNSISCMLEIEPWYFPIVPTSKGLVFGDLTLVFSPNERTHCNSFGGTLIPQDVTKIREFQSKAYFLLIVEKDAIFKKLLDEDIPNKLTRPFVIVTGKGFPDINTRLFVKRLWMALKIPVFILVDADPSGIDIMLTYRFGSKSMSHVAEHLALPNIRWIGIHPSEIVPLNITHTTLDQKEQNKIRSMLKRPYISKNPWLKRELDVLLENNFKAEIEGVIKSNSYLTDFYLINKFYTQEYM